MRVYLVGKHGGRTAFKITTAQVVSELEHIIDEDVLEEVSQGYGGGYTDPCEVLSYCLLNIYNIYYCDLDDVGKTAKKANMEIVKEAAKTYTMNNSKDFMRAWRKREEYNERRNR